MNLLASRQDAPVKPLVMTVVSPVGDTMISIVFMTHRERFQARDEPPDSAHLARSAKSRTGGTDHGEVGRLRRRKGVLQSRTAGGREKWASSFWKGDL